MLNLLHRLYSYSIKALSLLRFSSDINFTMSHCLFFLYVVVLTAGSMDIALFLANITCIAHSALRTTLILTVTLTLIAIFVRGIIALLPNICGVQTHPKNYLTPLWQWVIFIPPYW